jgi:predicted small metal-binding protein
MKEGSTMPSFACSDVGIQCGWKAKTKTEDELMAKIAEHAAKEHDMKEIPPELMSKIKAAIKK